MANGFRIRRENKQIWSLVIDIHSSLTLNADDGLKTIYQSKFENSRSLVPHCFLFCVQAHLPAEG